MPTTITRGITNRLRVATKALILYLKKVRLGGGQLPAAPKIPTSAQNTAKLTSGRVPWARGTGQISNLPHVLTRRRRQSQVPEAPTTNSCSHS